MKKLFTLFIAFFTVFAVSSQTRYLKGVFSGAQEVPPVPSTTATGVVIVKYNMATKFLELYGNYTGLTTSIAAAHIHRGQPDTAGPVIVSLSHTGGTTGTLTGTATLTQALEDSLLAGNAYTNVHTSTNTGGEIRARLTLTTDGQTNLLGAKIQGSQETPPNSSRATGWAYALVDKGLNEFYLTGSYSGLTTPSASAHVHTGRPGVPGGVIFPIVHTSATSGTVHAMQTITAAQAMNIDTGGTYVNIHNETFTGGEIRGQLTNNTTIRYLAGEFSGANEVPANASPAKGTVIVSYNTATNQLKLTGDYQGLVGGAAASSHIHLAPAGVNGDVIVSLTNTGGIIGILSATATLTDEQETALLAGNTYVNVHNSTFPGGEIRTQLMPTTSGETVAFLPTLTGGQEIPANSSSALGQAALILDKVTRTVYVSGGFLGLSAPASAAHIHRGQADTAGPVILGLRVTPTQAGTVSGSGVLSQARVDSMLAGFTYINIHNSNFPGGEIRGQLGNLILPVKLAYVNAFKKRESVSIIWQVTEEINASRYEIEQLNVNTGQWITKGAVTAKGSNTLVNYSYDDLPTNYSSPYVIYRLKMIDKDGKSTYSSILKVNFTVSKAELSVLNNPVLNGTLYYNITGLSTSRKADVSVIDFNGRVLLKTMASTLYNNNLKISHLPAGVYRLIVHIDNEILQKTFRK